MDKEILMDGGIAYDEALQRFVENVPLYEKYLIKFLDDVHMQDAIEAYVKKQYGEMAAQLHALKGMAGTLGITKLYSACSSLVADLRNNEFEFLDEKMKKVECEYEMCIAVIRKAGK